ncbi:MAG: hypothetical protein WC241_02650 [Candidatus Paceibacterota bacterium]|jgi:hypothetical protein
MTKNAVRAIFLFLVLSNSAFAEGVPACLSSDPKACVESIITAKNISDQELLARLVYAEGLSTGFADDQLVYDAIAWGVMNRMRLGESSQSMRRAYGQGIQGVIFKKGQFNPAISKRSPFSKAFICPDHTGHWRMAKAAAENAIRGANNPFIQTPWEKQNSMSLVVNFYYPQSTQAKGTLAPWEGNKSLSFVGDILIDGKVLSANRIRFYRLNYPPVDIKITK